MLIKACDTYMYMRVTKGYATRNDIVDDFVKMRVLDAIVATLKCIVTSVIAFSVFLKTYAT